MAERSDVFAWPPPRSQQQWPLNESLVGLAADADAVSWSVSISRHSALRVAAHAASTNLWGDFVGALAPGSLGQRWAWWAWPTAQLSGSIAVLGGAVVAERLGAAHRLAVGAAAAGLVVATALTVWPEFERLGHRAARRRLAEAPRGLRCPCCVCRRHWLPRLCWLGPIPARRTRANRRDGCPVH